jgi:predicted NAD/FAD-binding protein
MRRVGIVGAGMAGVSLAWLLDGQREVVLFEAQQSVGGNVQSINVNLDGQTFVVDIGAQYFHPGPYPTYVKLLTRLGLLNDSHSFPATITQAAPGPRTPMFVSPLLPGRVWPFLAGWNQAGLEAFSKAFLEAKKLETDNVSWELTLEAWLASLGLTQQQWEGILLPWAASLYSGKIDQARGLSARAAMVFVAKAMPDNPLAPLLYYVLKSGMGEVLRRMINQSPAVQVLTGAPVSGVGSDPQGGFAVQYAGGQQVHVDDLVFASSGPATLSLLAQIPGTAAQRTALQGIEFHDARLALHTDPVYAHAEQKYWSLLNCRVEGGSCEASMWMADVLATPSPATAAKVWKSWVTHRAQQPAEILHQSQFRHMLPTVSSMRAQNALRALQGRDGIWFAGGYTLPFDSQETALLSALGIAKGLLVNSARAAALAA